MTEEQKTDWWVNLWTLEAERLLQKYYPKKNLLNISHSEIKRIWFNENHKIG
jgi:hypothetical protein